MRKILAAACAGVFGLLTAVTLTQQFPLKQDLEILKEGPMRADKVKEGLYVIRGPFLPCGLYCPPNLRRREKCHAITDVIDTSTRAD
jgi:hypothetical protein